MAGVVGAGGRGDQHLRAGAPLVLRDDLGVDDAVLAGRPTRSRRRTPRARSAAGTSRPSTTTSSGRVAAGAEGAGDQVGGPALGGVGAAVLSVGKARCRDCSGSAIAPRPTTTSTTTATGARPTSRAQRTPLLSDPAVGVAPRGVAAHLAPNARLRISPRIAGSRVSATRTATNTVAAAARPIVVRNGIRTTASAESAMRTVRPAKTTAEPAVPTAMPTASSRSSVCSSSLR